jgi:hypothetical protein
MFWGFFIFWSLEDEEKYKIQIKLLEGEEGKKRKKRKIRRKGLSFLGGGEI